MQQKYPTICKMRNLNMKYQLNEVTHAYQLWIKSEWKLFSYWKNFIIIVNVLLNVLQKKIDKKSKYYVYWVKKPQTLWKWSTGCRLGWWKLPYICCHGNQSIVRNLFNFCGNTVKTANNGTANNGILRIADKSLLLVWFLL